MFINLIWPPRLCMCPHTCICGPMPVYVPHACVCAPTPVYAMCYDDVHVAESGLWFLKVARIKSASSCIDFGCG